MRFPNKKFKFQLNVDFNVIDSMKVTMVNNSQEQQKCYIQRNVQCKTQILIRVNFQHEMYNETIEYQQQTHEKN